MRAHLAHTLLLGAATLLAGCGNGQQDPVADLREVVERPTPPPDEDATKPLPEPVQPSEVTFQVLDRSPFQPLPSRREVEGKEEYQGPQPDKDRERGPLEQFALGSLQIKATMQLGKKWQAYISAPDGIVYTVKVGDYMGQQYGQVRKIGPNSVTVRELVPRGEGRWEPRERTVEIK